MCDIAEKRRFKRIRNPNNQYFFSALSKFGFSVAEIGGFLKPPAMSVVIDSAHSGLSERSYKLSSTFV